MRDAIAVMTELAERYGRVEVESFPAEGGGWRTRISAGGVDITGVSAGSPGDAFRAGLRHWGDLL